MILVTGGSGFLGAHLLVELTSTLPHILASKRATTNLDYVKRVFDLAGATEKFQCIEWKNIDLYDGYAIEDALKGVEQVYHCASEVSFNPAHHQQMVKNNITITANLVNAALYAGVKKFMHVSSIAALGRSSMPEDIDETRIWKTDPVNSKYGFSKYKSEMEVWRAYEEGLPVIVVNPAVILGYCPWNEGTGKMFTKVDNGMKFYTNGYTGWVDVKDVARCMVELMGRNVIGERFILSGETLKFKDVFERIAEALDKPKAKKEANLSIANMLVWAEKWRSKMTGESPLITRETLINATLECNYLNKKVCDELQFSFTPVSKTIADTAKLYISEKST